MSKISKFLMTAALLVSLNVQAQQGCERPWPVSIPDVADTKEQMLAVQTQVKRYLKQGEAYLVCNDAAQKKLSPESAASAQTLRILNGLYNNTVDEMQVVGEKFNLLVRAYKKNND